MAGILFLAIVIAALPAFAENSIVLRTQFPTEGERIELFVQDETGGPVAGARVKATYRPGSSVEDTTSVGTTRSNGRIVWVPVAAGIVTLSATWEANDGETVSTTTNVSVKFRSTPIGGLAIMFLAGLLLVGGSAVRILRVLRSGE